VAKRRVNTMIELVVNSLWTNVPLCTKHAKQVSTIYLYTTNLLLTKAVIVAVVVVAVVVDDVDFGRASRFFVGYEVHPCLQVSCRYHCSLMNDGMSAVLGFYSV